MYFIINLDNISPFPDIRTHNDNIPIYNHENIVKNDLEKFQKKSLFMVGRKKEVNSLKIKLNEMLTNKTKNILLVRGIMGSGKSLFIRKCLTEFVDQHRQLRPDT